MSDFHPKVSIIIPVFNGENYLREAIDSAQAQTYDNYEIIVINDGSTDRTEEIALSYGDKIRYFSKPNGGQSSALNMGIEKMNGEYFSWLSHDDVYYPRKIEEQIACLSQLPDSSEAFIYSNYEIIDKDSKHLSFIDHKKIPSEKFIYRMLVGIPVNGCTVLINKKLLERAGYFNLAKPHTSDVELFLKLGLMTEPFHLPLILVKSRSHSEQATFRNRKQHILESNQYGINALKLIPGDLLFLSSGKKKPDDVYKELAIVWANKGVYQASNKAFEYYSKLSHDIMLKIIVKIYCIFLYQKRIFKRRVKRLVS